ncbi:uncharacterized protein PV09_07189 [Verruconis gallopava]|uniref:NAD-dependent epimerase/dehydratase domain-containing protein n=1 Tax=Verruconis gallopava TaxID=253628 RepID=A0A0D2AQK1_9PEZI|nr:uncharacterized protein PV09_07189 [Verruconis gallopava]KIW01429.1 hypothetical protein PV09_07189 [Verruconis gallopava]
MGSFADTNGELVLITGATGHLGFKVLTDALKAGYRVRAAVRSEARADVIVSNPDYKALNISEGQLTFSIVPDLAVEGAYDEVVQNVKYIIHIASPITTGRQFTQEEYKQYFIDPAVAGTLGLLKSAVKAPSVERVVITSSVVAIVNFIEWISGSNKVYQAEDRVSFQGGPYINEFAAYSASKVASLNESEAWYQQQKPHFDLVYIHPSFIEGRDALVKTPEQAMVGTNGVILRVVLGNVAAAPAPGNSVHNDDVARLHVEALHKERIPAGSYIASSNSPRGTLDGTRWETINEIVAKHFPEQVQSGILKNNGLQKTIKSEFDISKTEKTFGWSFQEFEPQVVSVVQMYLDVLNKN